MKTQIRFQPTLFICLGTNSGEVGWRVKKSLQRAYGKVPVLRHLWIDIDNAVTQTARPWYSAAERVELSGFNPAAVARNIDYFPAIREWLPETAKLPTVMLTGGGSTQQMRLVGRLALFRMFNDRTRGPAFIDRLRSEIEALFEIENIRATQAMSRDGREYIVEPGCRVIFIYTKCGGSGSALVFDIAYLARHLLDGKDPTIISIGILPAVVDRAILSEAQAQKDKIRANCYAWFKEDNYLTENPYWNVAYPEGGPVEVVAAPFDYRFVVDMENQAGFRLNSTEDVFNMIAQAVFMDTGSSVAGAMRGFTANLAVLDERFQGKRRVFSSLAAASLVYPKERLLQYCAARMGRSLLLEGLLGPADPQQVEVAASTLLAQLRLRDADLLADLLQNAYIKMLNESAILKAGDVSAAAAQIDALESQNQAARRAEAEKLDTAAQRRLAEVLAGLEREIAQLAVKKGARFAAAVLERLLEHAPAGAVDDGVLSLDGLKTRLLQQGATEGDLALARKETEKARESLKRLDDGIEDMLERAVNLGGWKKKFALFKRDNLTALGKVNDLTLQLAAQRHAASLYDQTAAQADHFRAMLNAAAAAAGLAARELQSESERLASKNDAETAGYEFQQEIDLDFDEYYREKVTRADALTLFPAMIPAAAGESLPAFGQWCQACRPQVAAYAGQFFQKDLEETSLLGTLAAQARQRGMDAHELIEAQLTRLVEYCHPFWQYNKDRGLSDLEGKSIIGVEDEDSPLIPESFRNGTLYEIKTTSIRDRIDVVRVQYGLPAFMIRGVEECKAVYERRRKVDYSLHILPNMENADDVMPEQGVHNREIFAGALVFGYIVQSGSWYYYDPERGHREHGIVPGRDLRLAQGRERAEEVFSRRKDWASAVDGCIDAEVRQMGNAAAIAMLDEAIKTHRAAMAKMTAEDSLRRQYEKEISAFIVMQRRWGKVG